ncbi:MAG: ABC transporter ATP-binding protein [Gemmatimonadaceae bacterium]|nr:ABC transporter ATP-binding protein [Gloeobacterales cyanobacterium ES-bin-141]
MAQAVLNLNSKDKYGNVKKLLSLTRDVPRVPLYLGLAMMAISSLLDGLSIALMLPFLKLILSKNEDSRSLQLPIESLNTWISQQDKSSLVITFALALVTVFIVKAGFNYVSHVLTSLYQESCITILRKRLYEAYLNAPMTFFDTTQLGKLTSTLLVEIYGISVIMSSFFTILSSALVLAAYLGILVLVSWQLTILTVVLIGSVAIGLTLLVKKIKTAGAINVNRKRTLSAKISDVLGGVRVVKSFGAEGYETERFNAMCDELMDTSEDVSNKRSLIDPLTELTTMAAAMVILVCSYTLFIAQGLLETSQLLIFMLVLIKIVPVTKKLNLSRGHIQEHAASFRKVAEGFSLVSKYPVFSGKVKFTGLCEGISFRNVTFAYTGRAAVLKEFNLEVPYGQTVALVGASGAGKSTLAALVPRLYDISDGTIELDGRSITEYDLTSLRSRIAIVNQDTYIFNTSIRDNIAYGLDDVTDLQVIEAARLANAHEFICQLPNGYATLVGDKGIQLSGGQRQRISIARAILRDPDILILDEATSALDSQSENLVQEALERLRANRTVIVIAHRLATVRNADRIVVMDQGRITEQGPHEQLIANRGLYWSYHNLQSLPV